MFFPSRSTVLDSARIRSADVPSDQLRGFKVAKTSREHALREGSETALQLSVSMRSFMKRQQDLARPLADENRGNDPDVALILISCFFKNS
jgi:hypothetical protein